VTLEVYYPSTTDGVAGILRDVVTLLGIPVVETPAFRDVELAAGRHPLVPRGLLGFLGGFDEACEPRHLPRRHAHDIVNYLALNFFDGVLNGNAEALARLAPEVLSTVEDLRLESK